MSRARPYDRDTALDAALNLFWQKGYHATSLKDLEGVLNMKPGSIYAAFSSKEALYLSTLERYFNNGRNALHNMVEKADSPLGALADHMRSFAQSRGDDPSRRACMLVKTLLDTTAEDGAIAERSRQYLAEMRAEIAAAFEAACAQGEIAADADIARLARRYQAELSALRIESHRGADSAELAALAEDMAQDVEKLRVQSASVR